MLENVSCPALLHYMNENSCTIVRGFCSYFLGDRSLRKTFLLTNRSEYEYARNIKNPVLQAIKLKEKGLYKKITTVVFQSLYVIISKF
jgi:DNA polymerase elongation subunit (family B)